MRHVQGRLLAWLVGLCCVAPQVSAQQTLELANGDRLSGTLLRIDGASWIFRFESNDVRVPAAEVTAFTAPDPIGLRLADGTIGAATVASVAGALQVEFREGAVRDVRPEQLAAVSPADDLDSLRPIEIGLFTPFTRYWRASGSLGFSDKSGNSRARGISTSIEIARRSPKDRLRIQAGFNREQTTNAAGELEATVAKLFTALRADVFVSQRFFAFAETRQERDTFQDIALRSGYSGGLGVQLIATPSTDLSIAVSGGARIERFVADGSATAAVFKPTASLRQKLGPVSVDWELNVDSNVDELRDFQLRSQASLTTTVYKGLGFRVGILNEFDNTPRPGIEEHDMLVTTTLAYSIGQP